MPSVGTAGTASWEMLNKDTATFQEKLQSFLCFQHPISKLYPVLSCTHHTTKLLFSEVINVTLTSILDSISKHGKAWHYLHWNQVQLPAPSCFEVLNLCKTRYFHGNGQDARRMPLWQQRSGGRMLLGHTALAARGWEGRWRRKKQHETAPGTKDQARSFWSMWALLLATASVFKGRENGPQRLVILFSEEIDAGNREMLH